MHLKLFQNWRKSMHRIKEEKTDWICLKLQNLKKHTIKWNKTNVVKVSFKVISKILISSTCIHETYTIFYRWIKHTMTLRVDKVHVYYCSSIGWIMLKMSLGLIIRRKKCVDCVFTELKQNYIHTSAVFKVHLYHRCPKSGFCWFCY